MATKATWKPHTEHGKLGTEGRKGLPDSAYAFPEVRKEPLTDASHVRNALARFDQVKGVSDEDRDLAFANIRKAARHFKIDVEEKDWHELGKQPRTKNPAPAATAKKPGKSATTSGSGPPKGRARSAPKGSHAL